MRLGFDGSKVTVSSGIPGLTPHLGLEHATHSTEALAERYLNSSRLMLIINHSGRLIAL